MGDGKQILVVLGVSVAGDDELPEVTQAGGAAGGPAGGIVGVRSVCAGDQVWWCRQCVSEPLAGGTGSARHLGLFALDAEEFAAAGVDVAHVHRHDANHGFLAWAGTNEPSALTLDAACAWLAARLS